MTPHYVEVRALFILTYIAEYNDKIQTTEVLSC